MIDTEKIGLAKEMQLGLASLKVMRQQTTLDK
jgi:hypothetical protein